MRNLRHGEEKWLTYNCTVNGIVGIQNHVVLFLGLYWAKKKEGFIGTVQSYLWRRGGEWVRTVIWTAMPTWALVHAEACPASCWLSLISLGASSGHPRGILGASLGKPVHTTFSKAVEIDSASSSIPSLCWMTVSSQKSRELQFNWGLFLYGLHLGGRRWLDSHPSCRP
jgi:hypothetical protein